MFWLSQGYVLTLSFSCEFALNSGCRTLIMKSVAFYGALVLSVGVVICLCIISDASAIPWCRAPPVRRNWRYPRPPPVKKEKEPPLRLFSFMEPRGLPGRPQIALYQHINHRGNRSRVYFHFCLTQGSVPHKYEKLCHIYFFQITSIQHIFTVMTFHCRFQVRAVCW